MNAAPVESQSRPFRYTDKYFHQIQELAKQYAGIHISDAKKELVYGRLVRRLRVLGLSCFGAYVDYVCRNVAHEREEFVNALTTNLTGFFRESHHFDYLKRIVMPQWRTTKGSVSPPINIWCAGCSSGEEPYSLAMTLLDLLPGSSRQNVQVIATDIDTKVLARAKAGIYPNRKIENLDHVTLRKYFYRGVGKKGGNVKIRPDVQEIIDFREHNLVLEPPLAIDGGFDAIFCRNVSIYFDKTAQRDLYKKFSDALATDGYLFVGHSESLFRSANSFSLVGQSVYKQNLNQAGHLKND